MARLDEFLPVRRARVPRAARCPARPEDAVAAALGIPVTPDALVRTLYRLRGLSGGGSVQRRAPLDRPRSRSSRSRTASCSAPRAARGRRARGLAPFESAGPGQVRLVVEISAVAAGSRLAARDRDARRGHGRRRPPRVPRVLVRRRPVLGAHPPALARRRRSERFVDGDRPRLPVGVPLRRDERRAPHRHEPVPRRRARDGCDRDRRARRRGRRDGRGNACARRARAARLAVPARRADAARDRPALRDALDPRGGRVARVGRARLGAARVGDDRADPARRAVQVAAHRRCRPDRRRRRRARARAGEARARATARLPLRVPRDDPLLRRATTSRAGSRARPTCRRARPPPRRSPAACC